MAGLADQSRRPDKSPSRTTDEIERMVMVVRGEHPCWGGRKIRQVLLNEGLEAPPAASTITGIIRRHGFLGGGMREGSLAFKRFTRDWPNDLWQMDYKGHFLLANGLRCHALTVLDDHSRYNIVLRACPGETREEVQGHLIEAFRRNGLPRQILCDHGSPWGVGLRADGRAYGRTGLAVWLMRLGIGVIHGRPRHPQTQGKEERFHRTLDVEVIRQQKVWRDLAHCQEEFDRWRGVYNQKRPHEALEMKVPGDCYQLSPRPYPEKLEEVGSFYVAGDILRKVGSKGEITFGNRTHSIGSAFAGEMVALRQGAAECREVYYCSTKLGVIDLALATKQKGNQNPLLEQ
jgi:transposase InsO family protein